jgi:hypothetical protein
MEEKGFRGIASRIGVSTFVMADDVNQTKVLTRKEKIVEIS